MSLFPIAASKSLADARIACVFFLALEKTSCGNCTSYFQTVPYLFSVQQSMFHIKGVFQMITNQNITEFRRKFEKVYRNISERLDVSRWKSVIRAACEDDRHAALAAVVDFAHDHRNLPSVILKTILRESDLRNHPAEAAEIYGIQILKEIHQASVRTEVIDYGKLPEDCTDEQMEEITMHVRKTELCIEKGQPYLASREIETLNQLCPGNPGMSRLMQSLEKLRATGGIPSSVYGSEKEKNEKRVDQSRGIRLEQEGKLEEAAAYYEKLISEDYENYDAFCRLGNIYFEQEQISQADYIANLLLELGIQESRARVLKGRILEAGGQKEDALYYYSTAFMYDRNSKTAFTEMRRTLAELDGKGENLFTAAEAADQFQEDSSEPDRYSLSRLKVNGQMAEIITQADDLVARGRMTEAYYELSRASEKYPDSTLLTFKKAFALYLMKRGAEARKLLKTIEKEDIMYQRAGYLIEDIDCDLRDSRSLSDLSVTDQAEILFGAGQYEAALTLLSRASLASMDASVWAFKGKCEVENGHLDQALESFEHAVKQDDRIENAREIMAMICYVKGDYDRASELYDKAIRMTRDPVKQCEMKAQMLYQLNRKDELLEFRKTAFSILGHASDVDGYAGIMILNENPDSREGASFLESSLIAGSENSLFYQTAYKVYMKEGLAYRALLCTDAGISVVSNRNNLLFLKACTLYRLKKMNSAELVCSMLLSGEKKDSRVLYLMGKIQEARGNLSGALKWTLEASVNDQDNHDYAFAIAEMYFDREEYSKAQVYYTKALVLDEEDYVSFKRRAYIYSRQNNDIKAMEDINCALLLRPNDPEIYILMGNLVAGHGSGDLLEERPEEKLAGTESQKKEGSEKQGGTADSKKVMTGKTLRAFEKGADYYYSKAIEVAPRYVEGYLWRAKSYADQGRIEEALADAEKAAALDDQSWKSYMLCGIIRLMAEKVREAEADFVKAIRLDPSKLSAYSYLAKCNQAAGDYEKALTAAQKGIDLDHNYVDLYLDRGLAYYYMGLYQDAISDFTIVIMRRNELSPSAVEIAYRYKGMAYEESGQIENALMNYDMLLKFKPGASGIKRRMADLESGVDSDKTKKRVSSLFGRRKNEK